MTAPYYMHDDDCAVKTMGMPARCSCSLKTPERKYLPGRGPEELSSFINLMVQVKARYPDLRIGQIISNAMYKAGIKTEMFYVEDSELVRAVQTFLEETH